MDTELDDAEAAWVIARCGKPIPELDDSEGDAAWEALQAHKRETRNLALQRLRDAPDAALEAFVWDGEDADGDACSTRP